MIIQQALINMSAEHRAEEQSIRQERLRIWRGTGQDATPEHGSLKSLASRGLRDSIHFSDDARKTASRRTIATPVKEEVPIADLNIRILRAMIQRLTGRVLDIRLPQDGAAKAPASDSGDNVPSPAQGGSAGFSLVYDGYQSHYEYESTSFTADGVIHTADGQDIRFGVELNMSREFLAEQRVSIRAGENLKDPLTINFAGTAAELSQTSFAFDLDIDGREDQIAFAKAGSGFLALDRNGDGVISNGGELFGPSSGNGFAELAAFDDDGNGWIDENDEIYSALRIWERTAEGESRLFSLGAVGIGAIYLNHISTPFSVKDGENRLLGQVQSTGLFVRENGTVGTVQHIDLAI